MQHYRRFVDWLLVLSGYYLVSGSRAQECQVPQPIAALDSVFTVVAICKTLATKRTAWP